MDQVRTGRLIRRLRMARGLTQKALAEQIHVSDKAVSKWECGKGSPDISLLPALAAVFDIDLHVLLAGEINKNESEKGDMRKLKFYVCSRCGNLITAAADAAVVCCGSQLAAAEPRQAAEHERLTVTESDGTWFITAKHEMTKTHYISFAAYVSDSTLGAEGSANV